MTNSHLKSRSHHAENEGLREHHIYEFRTLLPHILAATPRPSKHIRSIYLRESQQTKRKDRKILNEEMMEPDSHSMKSRVRQSHTSIQSFPSEVSTPLVKRTYGQGFSAI